MLGKDPASTRSDFRHGLLGSFAVLAALLSAASGSELGTSSQLQLLDLNGRRVEPLRDSRAKATVFIFTLTDCPISNRYAPELRRLHEKFFTRGVTFWLVYPDPRESVETIRKHWEDYEYPFGALRDPRHVLVAMTGARVTPEAAVFVPGKSGAEMAYHGRIDDRYVDFGKARAEPTARDLQEALKAILDGRPVPSQTTRAVGCFIPDLE